MAIVCTVENGHPAFLEIARDPALPNGARPEAVLLLTNSVDDEVFRSMTRLDPNAAVLLAIDLLKAARWKGDAAVLEDRAAQSISAEHRARLQHRHN